MADWSEATIIKRIDWTETLTSFRFTADIESYKAGQFATVALDIGDERVARPFSFVNSPADDFHEIYFIVVPDGKLSPQLHTLQEGDSLWVAPKSRGFFTLDEVPDAEVLYMLSTGTALGPFISMLKTPEPWQRYKKIVLTHGVRTAAELSYQEEIAAFKDAYPEQFQMIPFVSREQVENTINGRITNAIEDGSFESLTATKITPESAQVMICGNPDMVTDTMELLKQRGMERNLRRKPGHITIEKYWN